MIFYNIGFLLCLVGFITWIGSFKYLADDVEMKYCVYFFCLCLLEDFEQDGEENEPDPDILNDPINQIDLQVYILLCLMAVIQYYKRFLSMNTTADACF